MCGIVQFLPGQMIDEEKFYNLVHNNWHSYGLVVKSKAANKQLRVIKKVPEIENDPEEIFNLLKTNMDFYRVLHVRHNTAGATNLDNCHPFDILKTKKRQIVFMHNGTMSEYKSKITENGISKDDPNGSSDTQNFVNQILIPMINVDYGTGVGDLSNPVLKTILAKFWPFGNRGILISNDQPSVFFGEWKEFGKGDILKVSTVEYFDKVIRGPEFSRREAAAKLEKEKTSVFRNNPGVSFSSLRDHDFNRAHDFFKLSESPINILSDWEVYNRESGVSVGSFTREELEKVYSEKSTCIALMDWIFTDYAQLYKEFIDVSEDKDKATKKIAGMAEQLRKMSRAVAKVG